MNTFNEWFGTAPALNSEFLKNIILSLFVVFFLWIIRILIIRIVLRHTEEIRSRYIWQKTTKYVTAILTILLIAAVWFEGIHDLTTFLGLVSAGIAIALRDIVANFAGWIFIIWVRPLGVGDRIQIGKHSGDVVDISPFHITLMEIGNWVESDQSTGRIINIPNGRIFSEALANYSKGFQYIWNEIPVLVTFESNWTRAKNILLEIVRKHTEDLTEEAQKRVREASKRFLIFYSKLTPTVYTTVRDSGVLLTVRYLCKPRQRRETQQIIWEDILQSFHECDDIDFAYPTTRFYDNRTEGKPGARAGGE